MITPTVARLDADELDADEIEQLDAIRRSQAAYWRVIGDQDKAPAA